MKAPDPPMDDDELAEFGGWLRSELTPVATTRRRAADVRALAHAELRRASQPPLVRARRRVLLFAETSSALAAGASYVLWALGEIYRR
jgi:hypothetical protein